MGNERTTEAARATPEVTPDPTKKTETGGAAAAGGAAGGAAAGATGAEAKTAAAPAAAVDVAKEIVKLVDANDTVGAIKMAGAEPKKALDALDAASKTATFYQLVKGGRPYGADVRGELSKVYKGSGSFDRKKAIFSARFGVTITARNAGTTFSEAELDTIHDQAALLPPAHVEGLSTFEELKRGTGGTHGGSVVTMGAQGAGAAGAESYSKTFRHEIGHAVDAKIGGPVETLRTSTAGWKKHEDIDTVITELGGLDKVPEAHRTVVKDTFKKFTTSNKGNQAAPGKFEDMLKTAVEGANTGDAKKAKAAWDEVNALWGKVPVMDVAKASYSGGYAHWNYQNFVVHSGRAYFCGHYYGKVMSMPTALHDDIKAWQNSSAAFSDKEWFAEVYAEWYRTKTPGTGRTFPDYVTSFMKDTVAKLGEPKAAAAGGGGGSNPKVVSGG